MAKASPKSSAADVSRFVHEAVLALVQNAGPLKLQGKKGDADAAFPAGSTAAIKEAIQKAKAADAPLVRTTSTQGKTEWVELAPAGVAAVGAAVAFAVESLSAVDGIRLAERVMAKRPETVVELQPLIDQLAEKQKQDDDREARQRAADAERQTLILEAMARYQAGSEQRKRDRIAALHRELADLGGVAPTSAPAPTSRPPATPAPRDAREFVRQEARRLVSAWTDAIRLGKVEARLALEVVLGNLSAMDQIGEEGEASAFDPIHHESAAAMSSGAAVSVTQPGWRLVEDGGVEYVVAKAKVKPRG